MKTVKIVLIVILCGLIFFLCSVLSMGMRNGAPFSRHGGGGIFAAYELVQEQEVAPDDITELSMKYGLSSNDVYIYEGTGENIVIREYANFTMEEGEASAIWKKDGVLFVEGKRREFYFFYIGGSRHAYTEIYLPAGFVVDISVATLSGDIVTERDFAGSENFTVSSTSGEIRCQKVEAGNVKASSTSGDIYFEKITGSVSVSTTSGEIILQEAEGNVSAATTSGDILLRKAEGDVSASTTSGDIGVLGGAGERRVNSTSGEIRLSDVNGRFDLSTSSGDIFLKDGEGFGKVKTISGEVDIELNSLQGSLDIRSTSGDVLLGIPSEASFAFDFDSTSGECETFFDEFLSFNKRGTSAAGVYGSPTDMEITVSTTSGDVWVSEK